VNPRGRRWRASIRLMERYADARSRPMQPCATIAPLVSIRQDVLQLIRPWALLGGLRTCRCECGRVAGIAAP
jgi:hypothetical protein